MAAVKTPGITRLIKAALEPEVPHLIAALFAMGAKINILAPATIEIEGVAKLKPLTYAVMYDRLEAGSLLIAVAVVGGCLELPQARWDHLDAFLAKLEEMGHEILRGRMVLVLLLMLLESHEQSLLLPVLTQDFLLICKHL